MNGVSTITMPADEAKAKYDEYREALRGNPAVTKEDRAILIGYRALAQGRSILNLNDAFRATGLDTEGRPRLAFARADMAHVYCRVYWQGRAVFHNRPNFRRYGGHWEREVAEGIFPRVRSTVDCQAVVPLIPAPLRPKDDMAKYHVFWEAEWRPLPPVDPMLLRHLHGSLYAVLAVWDLTPLERAVLAGRLARP